MNRVLPPASSLRKSAQRESNPHVRHGKAAGSRYIMGAFCDHQIVKEPEHRVGLEPTSPHYGCGILAARRPVLVLSVGLEGLEPSPARLRAGDAAANTLVPSIESAWWESNPRPASYKDAALTAELRASE